MRSEINMKEMMFVAEKNNVNTWNLNGNILF